MTKSSLEFQSNNIANRGKNQMINIRFLRRQKGISQDELAKKTKINQMKLSRIERGTIEPTTEEKRKIKRALSAKAPANCLQLLRKEAGISQAALAEAIGIHRLQISQAERNIKVLANGDLKKVADFFNKLLTTEGQAKNDMGTDNVFVGHTFRNNQNDPANTQVEGGKPMLAQTIPDLFRLSDEQAVTKCQESENFRKILRGVCEPHLPKIKVTRANLQSGLIGDYMDPDWTAIKSDMDLIRFIKKTFKK
jgi:transcriptional regulator with XRE-family HTH domain